MDLYLCYDIKGIQQFIYSVPKLKCIVGASAIIDEFDEKWKKPGLSEVEYVFSGGGHGAFKCSQSSVETLRKALVKDAHQHGLDLRIGVADNLPDATHEAEELFPYCPDLSGGDPCAMSGLWPVSPGKGRSKDKNVHPDIWKRREYAKKDALGKRLFDSLKLEDDLGPLVGRYRYSFFSNVSPIQDATLEESENREDQLEAEAAQAALGGRNRFAIIAIDGNDMGLQFRKFQDLKLESSWDDWLKVMSKKLKSCTHAAFRHALRNAVLSWLHQQEERFEEFRVKDDENGRPDRVILPFRPLIVGGDDVVMLCHSSFALQFVRDMSAEFTRLSEVAAQETSQFPLWPATGGKLTVSAGILYAKTTFPLHMAIPYAESLLGIAKGTYRNREGKEEPTPAAVDWDIITDTLVDHPASRRNRELRFLDPELPQGEDGDPTEIRLTRRPYKIHGSNDEQCLENLLVLKNRLTKISRSARAQILPNLRRPWSERVAFLTSIAKRHPFLFEQLCELSDRLGDSWKVEDNGRRRVTGLPDALELLSEDHRMTQKTTSQV